jgi:hypothetical protein
VDFWKGFGRFRGRGNEKKYSVGIRRKRAKRVGPKKVDD